MDELQPVSRPSMPDVVADQLIDRILSGQLEAGGPLPSERELAATLGVSRPTVRTALQQLAQAGLVETRQGGGTTVRDFWRHAGMDLLPRLLVSEAGVNVRVVSDIVGARSMIGPQVAGLAARRVAEGAGRAVGAVPELQAIVQDLADAQGAVARQRVALAFWDLVVELGGSVVFRLMFNGLRRAYEPAIEAMAPVMAAEVDRVGDYEAIAEAIAIGDADVARRTAEGLLAAGRTAMDELIAALDNAEDAAEDRDRQTDHDANAADGRTRT